MKFNEKLQKLRKENHLSQEALADALEVSRQAVSKWESGQTYPEMDKLISMCKIFKCTLDDLTNDDVEIDASLKQKKNAQNVVDELLEMIGKSYTMFRSMTFKEVCKCFFELFVLVIILAFFSIPTEGIYHLANDIFMNFGDKIGLTLSSIFHFIIVVAYLIVAIVVFVYIYKIRFLDHFEIQEVSTDEKKECVKGNERVTKTETVVVKEKNREESPFLHALGNLFVLLLKGFVLLWGIPCVLFLIFLCVCLVLTIVLCLKGVLFLGVLLGIISLIVLTILVIEWIFRFICNQKISFKRLLITFVSVITVIGISIGITMYDFTKISFIDEVPKGARQAHIQKEFDKNSVQFVDVNTYGYNVDYIADESLGDKVRIDITYYKNYAKYGISTYSNGVIGIYRNDIYMNEYNKLLTIFTENLSKHKIYNYEKLYGAEIQIVASSSTIEQLNARLLEEQRKIEEEDRRSYIEAYEEELRNSQNELYKKREEISRLEEQNMDLSQQVEEYKRKIQQYKEYINDL